MSATTTLENTCPQGHALQFFLSPHAGFTCDHCHKVQDALSEMSGCRQCDYDLCFGCAQRTAKVVESGAKPLSNFCGSCGIAYAHYEKFCQHCGQQRPLAPSIVTEEVLCPQGHAAQLISVGLSSSGYEFHCCNRCDRKHILAPEQIYRCSCCDYDICFNCVGVQPLVSAGFTLTDKPEGGFTFAVEPGVKPGGSYSYGKNRQRMRDSVPNDSLETAWKKMGSLVEAMSPEPPGCVEVFTKQNLFAKSVHAAFFDHHPLILSPDIIWLTIAQGLANHVDQNAESLRDQFVSHEGKKELVIFREGFVKGSPNNDWPSVFPEFSALIKENTAPGTTELIENDFSTTGPVERIVSHITLMDAVQHYFSYTMCCGCGFPSITLTGTPQDWEKIRAKAELLRKYDLDWWLAALLPALDQFVAAAHGRPDIDFWRSLCMINTGTSFPVYEPLTGWVQVFFPYLNSSNGGGFGDRFTEADSAPKKLLTRNTNLQDYVESYKKKVNAANFGKEPTSGPKNRFGPPPAGVKNGVKLEMFPPAMSSAPFTYKDASTRKQHEMAFFGGVSCLVQHTSGAIEPTMGWAVLDSGRLKGEASALGADASGKGRSGKGDSAKQGKGYNEIPTQA